MNGFELNIGTEVLKRMDEADKKLQQIATHSEEVSKAMKKLSTDGINSVVSGLTQMNTHLSKLSQNNGFSNMGAQASQSVDAINKMIDALAKLTSMQEIKLQTQQAKVDYKKEANDIKELAVAENERARALERQDKSNAANDKQRQALLTKQLANDTKELMNREQERGRQLILQNQKNIAAYTKQSVKIKQQIDEINRLAKAYRQMPTKLKQVDINKIIGSASKAKTINQHIVAIHNLRNALRDLDTTSKNYQQNVSRITTEINRNKIALKQLGVNIDVVNKNKRRLMDTASQLQRKLALIFSVSQVVGYANKLIKVRREMELQQKSLEVLLQSKSQADKLWQQTIELAVKSPFRVKQLVTYTRQLAAYRIETDKLHDTTRRLSDVSSGLGVDMQRLILAYGQVRAAGFLRGTELRQFTEAGIPMLDELSKHLTAIEGTSVSVGEVFERISKRMISFKDVTAVFENMTNAGGAFYKMQEEQSKTLDGVISNLHDSIDLMLNEIGKAHDGLMKGSINFARILVDNWKVTAEVLQTLVAGFALYKLNILLTSESLKLLAIDMGVLTTTIPKQLSVIQLLKTGWLSLFTAIKNSSKAAWAFVSANPWISFAAVAISAIVRVGSVMIEHNKAIEDITKNYDKLRQKVESIKFEFNSAKNEKDITSLRNNLLNLIDVANRDYGIKFKINVEELNTKELESKFNEISQTLFDANIFSESFAKAFQKTTEWTISDDVFEDLKELGTTASDTFEKAYNKRIEVVNKLRESEDKLTNAEKEALKMLSKRKDEFETEEEYLENLIIAYQKLGNEYKGYSKSVSNIGVDLTDVIKNVGDLTEDLKEARNEYIEVLKTINLEGLTDDEKTIRLTTAINALASQQNWNQFVKDYIAKWTKEEIGVPIKFKTSGEDGGLLAWQQTFNEKFADYSGFKPIEDSATKQSDIIERLNAQLKTTEQLYTRMQKAGEGAYSNYDLQKVEQEVKAIRIMRDWFGESDQKNTGKDWMSEVIKGVKEAHQEYLKLSKTLDSIEAKQMALDKYEGVFNEAIKNTKLGDIKLGDLTFETEEGAKDALRMLKELLPESAKTARLKVEEALAEIEGEVRIKTKVEEDKQILEKIEEMFGNYEVSLELQKLNIPPDLAKQLFGIDPIDLSTIRATLEDKLKAALAKGGQEDLVKDLQKQLEKVDEMEDKALQERLKKYSKYLTTAMGERVKIKMEEIRAISEIENTKEFSDDQKELAKQGVRKESQAKLDKLEWEEFKDSGMYVQLFEDLEYASTKSLKSMRTQLEKLKGSLKNLDADDLRHLYNQVEKLDDVLAKRNPFKTFINGLDDYRNAIKNTKQLDDNLSSKQDEYDKAKQIETNIDLKLAKEREEYNQKSKNNKLSKQENDTYLHNISLLESQLRIAREATKIKKEGVEQAQKEVDTNNKTKKTFKEAADEVGKYISQAANALPEIAGNLENVFGSMDAATRDTIDSIAEIGGGIGSAIQGFVSGNYIQAISGVAQAIGAIFAVGDKKKERQIQKEIEFVDKLGKAYEKLQQKIEDAYSINTLQQSGKNAKANLEEQISAYRRMISAEEDKKKKDNKRIEEWKDNIDNLQEQIKELNKDLTSTATAGIMDSVLSASQEFTDAWLSAFQETGNGLSGLEDNFKETMLEMVKQQAAMLISQSYIERWKKQLEQYINPDDLELSTDEAKKWVNAVNTSLPQLNQALENYFNAMQQAGVDLSGGTGGELSGLQRGIQGVTEETAQIIEAYLNSIRFFVTENNTYLSQIASAFSSGEVENPMVSQLRIIAQQTSAINTLLNSLTKSGHSLGGVGLKVFIS